MIFKVIDFIEILLVRKNKLKIFIIQLKGFKNMKKYYFNVEERYDIDLDDLGSQESLIFVSNGELRLRNIVKERWLMHERMNNEVSEDKLALLYILEPLQGDTLETIVKGRENLDRGIYTEIVSVIHRRLEECYGQRIGFLQRMYLIADNFRGAKEILADVGSEEIVNILLNDKEETVRYILNARLNEERKW